MIELRRARTGRFRPVRPVLALFGAVATIAVAAAPLPLATYEAAAQPNARGGQGVADFYRTRDFRPLWFGQPGRQVDLLLELLATADVDGLSPDRYRAAALRHAAHAAQGGNRRAIRRADQMLSQALVDYVRDLRRPGDIGIIYVDPELRPGPPSPRAILEAAARAPSLERYVAASGWMHPLYGQLRSASTRPGLTGRERELILINLERARELPVRPGRHVVVNVAAQRLFMYEDSRLVDSMRVVVGKPKHPTPMMNALIRYSALNPYWYVPADLAAERIAPNVVKYGLKYLREKGYEVVDDFVDPTVLEPTTVDWQAVSDGGASVLIRQLPGPANAMGRMKFMFPNHQGIYLHDTPEKELLSEAARLFSGGCVRLEDAPRLAAWLHGRPLQPDGAAPEQKVPLPAPVPVALTYLTAVPNGSQIAWLDDIYGRDAVRLAQLRGQRVVASR